MLLPRQSSRAIAAAVCAALSALAANPAPSAGAESIGGRVLSAGRRPIEHARVEIGASGRGVFSGREGFFELAGVETPVDLVVSHPRFETLTLTLEATAPDLELVLSPKQEVYETIAVSANRGEENFAPVSVASSVALPSESAAAPSNVTELVAETPGVAENGQGGIFQTYSVRGVSRQRVLTLISGMRIVGERRAGVSASFVDPLLLRSVELVRGPSSTYYGSGALGGVVQLFPRSFDRLTVAAGVESRGSERHLLVAGGGEAESWGVAVRDADRARDAEGETLDSGFSQLSGLYRRSWKSRGLELDLSVLGSLADDIGKASTDWPERVTTYPEEWHLVTRLAVSKPARWELELALHPNGLETEVVDPGSERSLVENRAFDLGLSWQRRFEPARGGVFRLGLDYFGRRGVSARERSYELGAAAPRLLDDRETLSDGMEDEIGLFGAWEWNWGRPVVVVGGRLAWQQQATATSPSAEEEAMTAFAGLVFPVGGGLELVANVGSGLRFPSLSERFFSGTTGRGTVVGNTDLAPERSLNLDAGLRFYGERLFVAAFLFRNEIDDYIERVELAPDELAFDNLARGEIEGGEVDGFFQLDDGLLLTFGGHLIEGRDLDGVPLADIPADRLSLGLRQDRDRWGWRLRWERRSAKGDPGSGEKAVPGANLVSASVECELRPGLGILLGLRNALDELYFNSADSKVPLAPGRSGSVSFRWARGGW